VALVVVYDDRSAFAGVGHLAELRILHPLFEALVVGQGTGQCALAGFPAARQLLDLVLAVGGAVVLVLDDVLLHLQPGDLGDALDLNSVEFQTKRVGNRAVAFGEWHGYLLSGSGVSDGGVVTRLPGWCRPRTATGGR